jgi:flagellar biosynthesis protein FlhA
MPGKQMSIDADLNSGLINETEARRRRREISEEADFYGSMDGASKFVRGDAIAAIIIVLVNIIGGLTIGILQQGMSPGLAAQTYTLLTVGEGLVAQIPALFISTAAGIVVTRAAADADLGSQITRQMLLSPKAVGTAAGSCPRITPSGVSRIGRSRGLVCLSAVAGGKKAQRGGAGFHAATS